MAKTAYNAKVGQRVYRAYKPLNAGVIIEITEQELVRVKWLDGTETVQSRLGLQDFDALLLETEQKFHTHQQTRLMLDRKSAIENGGNTVADYNAFLKFSSDNEYWSAYNAAQEGGYDPSVNWRKLMESDGGGPNV